jgi:hypothetical protein
MTDTITVDKRFCGPPESANGGYACGRLASRLHMHAGAHGSASPPVGSAFRAADAEVTLRRPPPLERPLRVRARDGHAELYDGDDIVAEAIATTGVLDVAVPPAVTVDDLRSSPASLFLRAPEEHPFPTCFVCGPNRAAGDGLRLFPTPVPGRDVVAASFTPDSSLPNDGGVVAPEIVWAALDCPSSFSMYLEPVLEGPYVLGRMAAHLGGPLRVETPYVVAGWRVGVDGRKLFAGSAIYDATGAPVAYARATWVRPRPAA